MFKIYLTLFTRQLNPDRSSSSRRLVKGGARVLCSSSCVSVLVQWRRVLTTFPPRTFAATPVTSSGSHSYIKCGFPVMKGGQCLGLAEDGGGGGGALGVSTAVCVYVCMCCTLVFTNVYPQLPILVQQRANTSMLSNSSLRSTLR